MNALCRIALAGLLLTLPLFLAAGAATAASRVSSAAQQPSVEKLLEGADQAFQEQKWVETIQLYEAVIAREDEHPRAWFRLGYCWHVLGRMDRAIPAHKRASEFAEVRPVALYNLGCAYALDGKPEPAFDALTEAHRAGFADIDKRVRDDSDLTSLLEHPRFESWLRGLSQVGTGSGSGDGYSGNA